MKGSAGSASAFTARVDDRVVGLGVALEQDAELVAAETVGAAVAGDGGLEVGAEALQERIAGHVAEGVVVLLEAVEVEEREGAPVGGRRLVGGVLQVAHQGAAVGQAGEAVGQRLAPAGAQQAQVLAEEHAAAGAGDEQRPGGQQRGGQVHGGELADDEHRERDGGEGGGQGQRAPGDLLDVAPRRGLPRGGRGQRRAQGPQRVDPRARDVGPEGRLVAEDRVGDDVGELAEAEQQPRAVHAPAVEAEGHDDERDLQDVADRIGQVEGDVDRVALGEPGQGGEDERRHHRGGGQAADHAVQPLGGADRAQARPQEDQHARVDRRRSCRGRGRRRRSGRAGCRAR